MQEVDSPSSFNMDRMDESNTEMLSSIARQTHMLGQPSLQPHPESQAYSSSNTFESHFDPLDINTTSYAAGPGSISTGATAVQHGGSLPGQTSTGKVPQPRMASKQTYPPLTIPDTQPIASGSGSSGRLVSSTFEGKATLPTASSERHTDTSDDGFPNERRLFHAYIYDYLYKQGYKQAARAFLSDLPTTAVVRPTQDPRQAAKTSGKAMMQDKGKKRSREDDEAMQSDGEDGGTAHGAGSQKNQSRQDELSTSADASQETSASETRGRKRKNQDGGGIVNGRLAGNTSDSMMDMMMLFNEESPTSPTSSTASATDLQNNLVISESLNKAAPGTSNSDQSSNGSSANSKDSVASTTSTAPTNNSVHMGPAPSRQSSFLFSSDTSKLPSTSSPPPFGTLTAEKDDTLTSPINDSPHPLSASSSKATVKDTSTSNLYDVLPKPDVQISAPQGFLFEWWTIFWDIYRSKHDLQPSTIAARVFMQTAESGHFPTSNGELLRSTSLPINAQHSSSQYIPAHEGAYNGSFAQPQSVPQDREQHMPQMGVRQLPFRQPPEDVGTAMVRQRTEMQSPGRSGSLQLHPRTQIQPTEEGTQAQIPPSQAATQQQHIFQREREHMLAGPPNLEAMGQRSDQKHPGHPAQMAQQQMQQAMRERPSHAQGQHEQMPMNGQQQLPASATSVNPAMASATAAQQPHSGARTPTPLDLHSSPRLAGDIVPSQANLLPAQRQQAPGRPLQAHPQPHLQPHLQPSQGQHYPQQVQTPAHPSQTPSHAMQPGHGPGGVGPLQTRGVPGQPGPASAQRRFAITGSSPFPPGQLSQAPGPGMVRMGGGPPPGVMGVKPSMHPQARLGQGPPPGQAGSPGMLHAQQQGYTIVPGHQGPPPGYFSSAPTAMAQQQQQAQAQAHAQHHQQQQQMLHMQQAQSMGRLSAQGGGPMGQPVPQSGPGPQPGYVNGSLVQRQQMQQHMQSQGQQPGVPPNPAAALAARQRPASVATVPTHVHAQGPDSASSPSNVPMRAPSRTAASSPFARPHTVDAQRIGGPEQQPGPFAGRPAQPIQMNPAYASASEDGHSPVRRAGLSPESQEQLQTRIADMQRQQQHPSQSMSPSMMSAEHPGALAAYRQSMSAVQQAQRQRQASLGVGLPGQQPAMMQGGQHEPGYPQHSSGPQYQQSQTHPQMHQQQHPLQQQQHLQQQHLQQQHAGQQQQQQPQTQMTTANGHPGIVHQPLFRQTPQQMPQQHQPQAAVSQHGNPPGEYATAGQQQGSLLQPYSQSIQQQQYSAGASPNQHSNGASPSAQGPGQEQGGVGMPLSQIQEAVSRHPSSRQQQQSQPPNQMQDGSMPPPRRPANGVPQQPPQVNRAPTPASQANTSVPNGMSQGSPEAAAPHTPRTPNTQAVASGVVTNPAPPATKGRKRTATDPTTKETKKKPRNSRASATAAAAAAAAAAANNSATTEATPPSSANDVQVPDETSVATSSRPPQINGNNNGGSLPHRQASIDMSAYFSNGSGGPLWAPASANGAGNIAVPGTASGHGRQGSITQADFMASLGSASQNGFDLSELQAWTNGDFSASGMFGDTTELNFDEYLTGWDPAAA